VKWKVLNLSDFLADKESVFLLKPNYQKELRQITLQLIDILYYSKVIQRCFQKRNILNILHDTKI